MKVNSVSSINFLNQIRVNIPDKTFFNKDGYKKSDLGKLRVGCQEVMLYGLIENMGFWKRPYTG